MKDDFTHKIRYNGSINPKITDKEIIFCDNLLKGKPRRESIFLAGFYPMEKKDDPTIQKRASSKATALLKKRCIRIYLNKNASTLVINNDNCDRKALKIHIYEIAMGNVTQTVITKDGDEIDVPPSFKDQVSAAALFYKIDNEDRMEKISSIDISSDNVTSEIDAKVSKFISRYNNKTLIDNNSAIKLEQEGILDSEYREVALANAMKNFIDEETKID